MPDLLAPLMQPPAMRILIGCETSGVMRRAFAALGHEAWSCDLLPADDGSNRHIRGDVRDHLADGWDMLVVAHPPCTRLCNSGVRWLHVPPKGKTLDQMWADLAEGAALFTACWQAPVDRVAIENPVMHQHGKALMPADLPKPQIVQPWMFGEPAKKATGFYLRGLAPLVPTNKLPLPVKGSPEDHRWQAVHRAPPGPDRWKFRSRTFDGIAAACAMQWRRSHHPTEGSRRMTRTILILALLAGAAFATPGDVQDPETGEWGQPEKPEPEPERPDVTREDKDKPHRPVVGYLCTGADGAVWSHGKVEPGAEPDRLCSCFDHPKGQAWVRFSPCLEEGK